VDQRVIPQLPACNRLRHVKLASSQRERTRTKHEKATIPESIMLRCIANCLETSRYYATLGDGQNGHRYVVTVTGRGLQFRRPSKPRWPSRAPLPRLGRFSTDGQSTLSSFAYALCDQLATTFTRVKDEPSTARQCYAVAMVALSVGHAIDRLKRALNAALPPRIKHEIETLLSRVSETLARPSRAGLVKQAWDTRGVRMSILKEARATNKIKEATALAGVLVGCESLRANLLKARVLLNGARDVR
jgi:hypothetical protein